MELFDGKEFAEEIKEMLRNKLQNMNSLQLAIVMVGGDPATKRFVERKVAFGESVGISVKVHAYPADISAGELRKRLAEIVHSPSHHGVILQLPLPKQLNTEKLLNSIPPDKDVDVLSSRALGDFVRGRSKVRPPVVAAIETLLEKASLSAKEKQILVIGSGKTVGEPVALWCQREGYAYTVVPSEDGSLKEKTLAADLIVTGTGVPGLITTDMVRNDVIIFDVGFGKDAEGKFAGDVDKSVFEKTKYVSPVPGGVGPLTVAHLFGNLIELASRP
jgi:methylenetetrahydrofolate dehydrogenase (NADP+)/methenyltetrahydrofolate cyclohydrolase